ncbi:5'-nucleotidase C-terminal domain-containing protein [Nisaea acidiphila]|uniref:5'-nucleotidase C-terminal domain-containing protein n=1 Tax=Nisaea acidiphila TaxID=1862145 RepID=A0A9J7AWJ4_9PROT|nr:5'-nucleotidase C-terminal domain-containing protein [Nisaea acidiphila]UUX51672.1 5'-nucleotidase C-terminal domain-containing protein [Nisaea acidiphila]
MPFPLRRVFPFLLVVAIAAFVEVPAVAEPLRLSIVHVNDWDRLDAKDRAGGAAKIASIARYERDRVEAEGGQVLLTFGGDMISPSLLSGFDKGAHMIALANVIGFNAAVLGNHEFDFGPEVLIERLKEAKYPVLGSNISYKGEPGFPGAERSLLVEAGEYKVGLLGLTTTDTPSLSSSGPDVAFAPLAEAAAEITEALRAQGADLVIALTHAVYQNDLETLRQVAGIDIVLGGHDHLVLVLYDGKQAILKSGSQGNFVGIMDILIDRVEGRSGPQLVWQPSFSMVNTIDVEEDPEVAQRVAGYKSELDKELAVDIGLTEVALDTRRASVRTGENAFGNLVADAMRVATGADAALTNGGGIRGDTTYIPGRVLTRKDILTELPFGNRTVTMRLKGSDLKAALENGVSKVEEGAGRFPHVSGISFAYAGGKPAGARVTDVKIGDLPLDLGKVYVLATNDFVARGGDGYASLKNGKPVVDASSARLMASQVIEFIQSEGGVKTVVEGRVRRLD